MDKIITISILGCGWYGLPLARALAERGYKVKGSTTSAQKLTVLEEAGVQAFLLDVSAESGIDNADFFDCDILWIAIPPKTRHGEGDNYIKRIQNVINAAQKHGVKQVVHISSTGVYGDHNLTVTELTPPAPISQAGTTLLQVEDLLRAQTAFTNTIIRFGGLIGPGREPGRFFAGKKNIPNGQAPINLIHLDDCIGISLALLDKEGFGYTYNACAPHHPPKADFYTKAAIKAGLEQPEFTDELREWKIVSSIYTDEVLNYHYRVNNWDKWLAG